MVAALGMLAVAGSGAGLWRHPAWAQPPGAQPPGAQPPAVAVEAVAVEAGPVTESVLAVGSLRSNESVIVRPEIPGRVVGIHFQEGTVVKAGAPLVTLDSAIAAAELADAEASLDASRRNAERAKALFGKGVGTERTLDEARATLERDLAKIALARARLEKTKIVAPFDGIAGLRLISVGAYVAAGEDLVNVESIDPIKIDFRIPERYLADVSQGQAIDVAVDAYPGRVFSGAIYALDPLIDREGRAIALRARIPNTDGLLRPGLFAKVTLTVARREHGLIIPEQAIVPFGEQRFVYRVVDGHAKRTRVTIGVRRPGRVEVTGGLAPGDLVVTAGQLKIQDGAPVKVLMPPPKS
jgi:membrane fusion protein (multidrug efflux system)